MISLPPIIFYAALWLILLGVLTLLARLLAGSSSAPPADDGVDVAPEAPDADIVPLWGGVAIVTTLLLAASVGTSSVETAMVPMLLVVILVVLAIHAVRRGPDRT